MLKATVNNRIFDIHNDTSEILVNEEILDWDLQVIRENTFHILFKNHSYTAEVLAADYQNKAFLIKINQNQYQVSVKDRFDLLLTQLGINNGAQAKVNDLKAPMPGLIVDIKVKVGDTVNKGDSLLILEAMKMENVLKATGEGKIKKIRVSSKENVEKNQILIEFE